MNSENPRHEPSTRHEPSNRYPAVRQIFGENQVRNVKEITSGLRVVDQPRGTELTIVGEPFNERGGTWVKATFVVDGRKIEKKLSLADANVVPYKHGNWNPINWLEKVED